MRDLLVSFLILGSLPVCFARPWVGVLIWSWLSYMNPHQMAWDFAREMPFAMLVAVATLAGVVFARDRKSFVWTRESVILLSLWGWFTVTTLGAMYPEVATEGWTRFSKILVMALLIVPFFQDRKRLHLLLVVTGLSLGYYGVKGAIFALRTSGEFRVWGPTGLTFITDNNSLALALNMCLPILWYGAKEERRPWLRRVLYLAFAGCLLAVPFTYSRSGILGLAAVLGLLLVRSRRRVLAIPLGVAAVAVFLWFAPQRWEDRVSTIWEYEQDDSARARLITWRVSYELALDNPMFGGGFGSIANLNTFKLYAPDYPYGAGFHNAHSIYFNVLGEHGWVGLILFLVLMGFSVRTLGRLRRLQQYTEGEAWIGRCAEMLQVSLVAYLVSGAFLSLAYFDLPYHILAMTIVLTRVGAEAARRASEARIEGAVRAPAGTSLVAIPKDGGSQAQAGLSAMRPTGVRGRAGHSLRSTHRV